MATAAQLSNLETLLEASIADIENIDTIDDLVSDLAVSNSTSNRLGYQVDIVKGILESTGIYTDAQKLQLISDTLGAQNQ